MRGRASSRGSARRENSPSRPTTFELNVPKVIKASAEDLAITYDPGLTEAQQIVSAKSVTVAVPALKLEGEFTPSDATPGLVVYTDGFAFGDGKVSYTGDIKFGSFATVENPFVRLGNFSFRTGTGAKLGSFGVGATKVEISAANGKLKVTGEELEANVAFDGDYGVEKFTLSAGTMSAELGNLLTVRATGLEFTPTASGTENLLKLDTGSAELFIPAVGLKLGATVGALSVSGDGTLTGPETLRVSGSFDSSTATSLRWPAIIPLTISKLDIFWPEFRQKPDQFRIEISAGINGQFAGLPVEISGGVDRLVIDPQRVQQGKSPIVSIDGFSAKVKGEFGAGSIEAGVVVGILRLDEEGNVTTSDDPAQRIFYGAFQGSLTTANNMEAEVRIGFSERGFIQGYFGIPTKIILEPISGLNISQVRGAITFNAPSLVTPQRPTDLANPDYKPTSALTVQEWQEQLKQAVVNQVTEGSRIFIIDANLADVGTALTKSTIEFDDDTNALLAAFDDAKYEVASEGSPGEITNLVAGEQWLITHKGRNYVVVKNPNGSYDVTEAQFTLPDQTLWSSLAAGTVSPTVVATFLENNITLSPTAQVSAALTAGGQVTKWRIEQDGVKFYVTKRGGLLAVTGNGGAFQSGKDNIRLELGATLTTYAPSQALVADVDIVVSTEGKFLIVGKAKIADSIKVDIRMFFDLSQTGRPNPEAPLSILFLADIGQPEVTGQTTGTGANAKAPIRLSGAMTFEFLDEAGNLVNPLFSGQTPAAFRFRLLGRGEIEPIPGLKLVVGGDKVLNGDAGSDDIGYAELKLTIRDDQTGFKTQLDLSGSLSLESLINAKDVLSVAGTVILEKPVDGPLSLVGAIKLDFDPLSNGLTFLKNAGLTAAQADLALAFNSTAETKELELKLPGRDVETFVLTPTSLSLEGSGVLHFEPSIANFGADLQFDGAFAARISIDSAAPSTPSPDVTIRGDGGLDVDLFVAARLDAGAKLGGARLNLLTLDGMGMIALRDLGAKDANGKLIAPTVAGRLDLSISRNLPYVLQIDGTAQLLFNTSSSPFVYVVPDRIADRIRALDARRNQTDYANGSSPSLPAVTDTNGVLTITVPNAPPHIDGIADVNPGPYFVVQLGDPTESPGFGGNPDPNGNGLKDVTITVLNTFQLNGDARIVVSGDGFSLLTNAQVRIALPGAENLLRASSVGSLTIGRDGLYGALGTTVQLNVPSLSLNAGLQSYFGINTTGTDRTLDFQVPGFNNPTIAARSGVVAFKGGITIGGFGLTGEYKLSVGAQSIQLAVDANLRLFDIDTVQVKANAAIYYGASSKNNGLVLSAGLAVAPIGTSIGGFKLFEIGGQFYLNLDTRPSSARFEVAINNASVTLLDALKVSGSAKLIAVAGQGNQPAYFRVEGAFHGRLLGVVSVNASGFFDSRGYFGVNIAAAVNLGTDDFGFRAGGSMFVERSPAVPLDFGASLYAQVRAFGITVAGVDLSVDYDGYGPNDNQTGRITAAARIQFLFIDETVRFTVGYLRLKSFSNPGLAQVDGNGNLTLNVGARAGLRAEGVDRDAADEAYTIESLGRSANGTGEDIRISAFGTSQTFGGVRSINGNFGAGNDQLIIDSSLSDLVTVYVDGGDGNDILINQSSAPATLLGGDGSDTLLTSGSGLLSGDAGNDTLAGGAGSRLLGGAGNDTLYWQLDRGRPAEIDGGADLDKLTITGTDNPETYTLSAQGSVLLLAVTGSVALGTTGLESLSVNGRGGADVLNVFTSGIGATGLTNLSADLTRTVGKATTTAGQGEATSIDDGAADAVNVYGSESSDTVDLSSRDGSVVVTFTPAFEIAIGSPNRAKDTLTVFGQGGNDVLTLAGPLSAPSPGKLIGVTLDGGAGDDAFTLPIAGAIVRDTQGFNTSTYTVAAGDSANVTLTGTTIASGNGTSNYAARADSFSTRRSLRSST